ncbi:MAG: ferrous iron transport protein B [Syntrophobacteraceae bacterium CG07_land_8_20_14_0_80_61_8]|nr:MAG: ferrous iron transport protein B [Syntrophobacteraceae bacterium CG07_land_8_20_14_0_80_61_8]
MTKSDADLLIALAGNPNCGKSTLFNAITGSHQHVGNYPGITVEKKEGSYNLNGTRLRLVDLPGTYSLTAYSPEELVARDFLVEERPRVVINIVDASNLERNLYLTMQILELGIPVVVALNMMDVAANRGIEINLQALAQRLGTLVVPTIARRENGIPELLEATVEAAGDQRTWVPLDISYGPDIDPVLQRMQELITAAGFLTEHLPARWTALKYLEADDQVIQRGQQADKELSRDLLELAAEVTDHIRKTLDSYPEAIIADHRYGFISALLREGVLVEKNRLDRLYLSDQVDRVLTHRLLGPLIMLIVLYGMYQFTFTYSEYPVSWLEAAFSHLAGWLGRLLPEGPLKSLAISGIVDGVGGVVGFVPLILFMFLAIAFLEDTGYLARAAYMLDRVFRIFGLHGNSFMAYIVSGGIAGGCAVPGVMATRTLRSSRERLATLLTTPFMSCGAKLPVFAMLIAAFFSEHRALMMFFLTLFSWSAALLLARLLRSTILRGPSTPFLLELPPYRLPTLKGLMIHTWERTWQYIRKAGSIILAISILLWALMSYPALPEARKQFFQDQRTALLTTVPQPMQASITGQAPLPEAAAPEFHGARARWRQIEQEEALARLQRSAAGRLGLALEPVSRWCGFDWRVNVALIGGFAAKEIIISTLGTAYSLGNVSADESLSLSERLARDPRLNPLAALSLMVFIMLYTPCFVTLICIVKEAGSWRWAAFATVFNTLLALLVTAAIHQGGIRLGLGG